MKKKYINYVCNDCGMKASEGRCFTCSTWHYGECDICKDVKPVTEFRDFYYGKKEKK